jgi:hypothetical protein
MAQTHNTFFRALNNIYQLATSVIPATKDCDDFLLYCRIVFDFIHTHQCHEESIFFPAIETETVIAGLMSKEVVEHEAMDEAFSAFGSYINKIPSSQFSPSQLRRLIDAFAPAFEAHNHAEIATLISLYDKIDSGALKRIDESFRAHAEKESDMFKAGPLVLGCQDKTFIVDDDLFAFPAVPFVVKIVVDLVLSRKFSGAWRFNPSSMYGTPRALPVLDEKENEKMGMAKKGLVLRSGIVTGRLRNFVPVFAALISVWSLLSLVFL